MFIISICGNNNKDKIWYHCLVLHKSYPHMAEKRYFWTERFLAKRLVFKSISLQSNRHGYLKAYRRSNISARINSQFPAVFAFSVKMIIFFLTPCTVSDSSSFLSPDKSALRAMPENIVLSSNTQTHAEVFTFYTSLRGNSSLGYTNLMIRHRDFSSHNGKD